MKPLGRVSVEIKTAVLRHHPGEPYEPGRVLDFIYDFDWSAFSTWTQDGVVEISGMVAAKATDCDEALKRAPRHKIKQALLEMDRHKVIWYHKEGRALVPQSWNLISQK